MMKNKKVCSLLLIMIMILGSFFTTSKVSLAAISTPREAGTETLPFLIRTVDDLYNINTYPNAHYRLMNDLDLENIRREPMKDFYGVFDGNGYTIKNLYVTGTSTVGLFSSTIYATIKNLTVDTAVIQATGAYTGVISGNNRGSELINISVKSATVNGAQQVGGLSGQASSGTLINCSVTNSQIKGTGYVGGLIGNAGAMIVYQCYSASNVSASGTGNYIGGLIGHLNSSMEITQSFVKGEVTGTREVGGFVGGCATGSNYYPMNIDNCYAITTVKGSTSPVTGFVYCTNDNIQMTNCYASTTFTNVKTYGLIRTTPTNSYFDQDVSTLTTPAAQARTTEVMYTQANYEDWDFNDIWSIEEGKDYPKLRFKTKLTSPGDSGNPGDPGNIVETSLKVVLTPTEVLQLSVDDSLPENANMEWSSSDHSVATVDASGAITAFNLGNVVITAKEKDGSYTDYIRVIVVEDASDYRLAVDLKIGTSCRLTIDDYTNTIPALWNSLASGIATVKSNGKVTAVSKGMTLVNAIDQNGINIGRVYVRVR